MNFSWKNIKKVTRTVSDKQQTREKKREEKKTKHTQYIIEMMIEKESSIEKKEKKKKYFTTLFPYKASGSFPAIFKSHGINNLFHEVK